MYNFIHIKVQQLQINYSDRKPISDCLWIVVGKGRKCLEGGIFSMIQRNLVSDIFIILRVMIALEAFTYVKIYQAVHFKYVNFTIWQLSSIKL